MPEMSSHFCDELAELFPPAEELLKAFKKHGDEAAADRWLAEEHIDSAKLKTAGVTCRMVQIGASHDFDVLAGQSRGDVLYTLEAGTGYSFVLGVPIYEGGVFQDLLLIDPDDPSWWRVMYGRADWLGADAVGMPEIRLHHSPLAWLEAGGTGVANVHPYQRQHFIDLELSSRVLCDDIDAAMEAWEWGFGASDAMLDRIVCDDTPENIAGYYQRQAFWAASRKAREEQCQA